MHDQFPLVDKNGGEIRREIKVWNWNCKPRRHVGVFGVVYGSGSDRNSLYDSTIGEIRNKALLSTHLQCFQNKPSAVTFDCNSTICDGYF